MVGVSAVLDGGRVPSCTMVQAESATSYRLTVEALRRETDRHGALYDLLTHYSQALMGFVMQSTACNAAHSVEQRLARWLLHAHDRVGKDEFPLTQEFAAMMLGAARPRHRRRGDLAETRFDQILPRPRRHRRPSRARTGVVRMLQRRDGVASGRDGRIARLEGALES
jgi:hypothetical protein